MKANLVLSEHMVNKKTKKTKKTKSQFPESSSKRLFPGENYLFFSQDEIFAFLIDDILSKAKSPDRQKKRKKS